MIKKWHKKKEQKKRTNSLWKGKTRKKKNQNLCFFFPFRRKCMWIDRIENTNTKQFSIQYGSDVKKKEKTVEQKRRRKKNIFVSSKFFGWISTGFKREKTQKIFICNAFIVYAYKQFALKIQFVIIFVLFSISGFETPKKFVSTQLGTIHTHVNVENAFHNPRKPEMPETQIANGGNDEQRAKQIILSLSL